MTYRQARILAIVSFFSLSIYILVCLRFDGIGFPLDDAWIHQTYARNLVQFHEWTFIPGNPSAGSTAPLWTAVVAFGYILKLGPFLWTFILGWALLFTLSVLGEIAFFQLLILRDHSRKANISNSSQKGREHFPWIGVLLALEWHLVWAAGSGMETLLFAVLSLAIFLALILENNLGRDPVSQALHKKYAMITGLLIGLSVWVRPDGITFLGPAVIVFIFSQGNWVARIKSISIIFLSVAVIFLPYMLFNHSLSGEWWPTTFYAKQAEYIANRESSFIIRFYDQVKLPMTGLGAILLPGVFLAVYHSLRQKNWWVISAILWALGFLGIYAWRLPVTYQHGRYVIPVIPVLLLVGSFGCVNWIQISGVNLYRRVLSRVWVISIGIIVISFWCLGAFAYARDVAVINSEMVTTARWIEQNTEPNALIASHDIGAIGYFSERRIIDLAGLISPAVIPIIRDEKALSDFLDSQHANYLVTFPGWYPELVKGLPLLFSTNSQFSPLLGGENMHVYRWLNRQ